MKEIKIGDTLCRENVVSEDQLAIRVGSGNVSVYATPMMLALMEGAAAELLGGYLEGDETSVGTMISSSHLAATPVGMKVSAVAQIVSVDGRRVCFTIKAEDGKDVIGEGTHERFVVYKDRFEKKAEEKRGESEAAANSTGA